MNLAAKKKELHSKCLLWAENKISELKSQISELNRSFEDEGKSSAGDKHETSRAMAQLETEKLHTQLHQSEIQLGVLRKINPEQSGLTVQIGSLVKTDKGFYFIAIPLGKVDDTMVISVSSPLGKELIGKKSSDQITMNGIQHTLIEVN